MNIKCHRNRIKDPEKRRSKKDGGGGLGLEQGQKGWKVMAEGCAVSFSNKKVTKQIGVMAAHLYEHTE